MNKTLLLCLLSLSACFNPIFEEEGLQCGDKVDNDEDGLTDCDEASCKGNDACIICGDGTIAGTEQCDDGAANSDTAPNACRTDCTRASCGDNVIDNNEACEGTPQGQTCQDLGFAGGQLLCDAECQIDTSACVAAVEICDNGSDDDNDGLIDCDDCGDCNNEPFCGKSNCPFELCDDNIDNDGDGLIDCQDVSCDGFPGCLASCGNGVLDPQESCDGSDFGGIDCSLFGLAGPLLCTPSCILDLSLCQNPSEICNDAFDNDFDNLVDCQDPDCAGAPNCAPLCGNGTIEFPEQCDGLNLGGNSCTTINGGFGGGTLTCAANCLFNVNVCFPSICGDGFIDPSRGEQCDDGNVADGDGCSEVCLQEFCGDFITSPALNEQCDEGPNGGPGCDVDCTISLCGDGTFNPIIEQCDDGNALLGDGCRPNCTIERCGDFIVDALRGEQCDDGNIISGDGCSAACQTEGPICGNGVREAGEQCDDANLTNGDGCNSTCQREDVIQEAEVNDSAPTANFIGNPDRIVAGDLPGADLDFFSMFLFAGTTIQFETSGFGGLGSCDGDTVLTLIDTDGATTLAIDDDGGNSPCSRISFTIQATGAYSLQVRAFNSSVGVPSYLLFVTDVTPPQFCGNNIAEAGEQCDGSDFNGETCSSATGGLLPDGNLSCDGTCSINSSACFCIICP